MLLEAATIADIWAWAAAAARASGNARTGAGRVYRCLLAQAGVSDAYTLREEVDGAPLAIAGILDLTPGEGELWFLGPPSGRGGLGVRMVRAVRIASDWLDRSQALHPRAIVCHVRAGHRDGQRLARMLGFRLVGVEDELETWRRQ